MRHIQKQGAPKALSDWKKHNRLAQQNLHYDNLGREQRRPMLQALLAEQHGLCAYTLRRIDLDCAHIEHVLPRSQHPDKTLDWANLLACFPGPQQGCAFGAKHKDAYDPADPPRPSPLSAHVSCKTLPAARQRQDTQTDSPKTVNLSHR